MTLTTSVPLAPVITKRKPDIELPAPGYFDPARAADFFYRPDQEMLLAAAMEWRTRHGIKPAARDRFKIHLLMIDEQKDFCFPEGSLFVGGRSGKGAVDDTARLAKFIYRNLAVITDVTCTMDTHFPFQIFFTSFWLDEKDRHPPAHTILSLDDLRAGRYRPNPAVASWLCSGNYGWLLKQVEFYVDTLGKAGKYQLYLWPPHCLLGSDGHCLAGLIHEARLFHSFARGAKSWVEVKGGNTLTENYSVLAPEVLKRHDGKPLAQRNALFIGTLLDADAVVIAGQAASHCVKSSIDDLLGEIRRKDDRLAKKVYILRDCMSAVAVPDGRGGFLADFTAEAEAAIRSFEQAGMNVVDSTEPVASWPGINL